MAAHVVEDIVALLGNLGAAGGVWYAVNTNEPATYPYLVVQRIASEANVALGGPSGLQNTRVQIDVYARRMADAVALEGAIESTMAAWAVQNVPLTSQDFFDDIVRAFRVSKDYSIWSLNG